MKKIVYLLIFVSFLFTLRAQDTIYPFATEQILEHDTVENINTLLGLVQTGWYTQYESGYINLSPMYIQQQMVTGLAIPFEDQHPSISYGDNVTIWGIIAKIHGSDYIHPTFHLTRPWTFYDVISGGIDDSIYDIHLGLSFTTSCPVQKVDTVLRAKLFYFDEPLQLSDTIWVGAFVSDAKNHAEYFYMGFSCFIQCPDSSTIPRLTYILDSLHNPTFFAYNATNYEYNLVCPISTLPDTDTFGCPEVEGFGFAGMNAGSPTFVWDTAAEHDYYQIAYGAYNLSVRQLQKDTTSRNFIELFGLSPDIYYQARVRARCHHQCPIHDTVMWTAWSAPVYFYTGDHMPDTTHQPEGIDIPGEVLPFAIVPNPSRTGARQVVEIGRQVPLQGLTLTLHDAAGHEVLRMEVKEHRFALPASLPAGVYVATLASPQGTAVRRVVVES